PHARGHEVAEKAGGRPRGLPPTNSGATAPYDRAGVDPTLLATRLTIPATANTTVAHSAQTTPGSPARCNTSAEMAPVAASNQKPLHNCRDQCGLGSPFDNALPQMPWPK